jgi:hypothetical protein
MTRLRRVTSPAQANIEAPMSEPTDPLPTDSLPIETQERRARILDAAAAVLFLLLGLYVTYASVTEYQAFSEGRVGAGVLPFLVGVTLIITSVLILLRLRHGLAVEAGAEMPTLREASRAGALLLLTIVTVALMPVLGTLVALAGFGFVEVALLERRGWFLGILTAILIPAVLYFFFEAVLGVPLPRGEIGLL